MAQNLKGRLSREAARQIWKLVAKTLELDAHQAGMWMSTLDSLVFADELSSEITTSDTTAAAALAAHVIAGH